MALVGLWYLSASYIVIFLGEHEGSVLNHNFATTYGYHRVIIDIVLLRVENK